MRGRPHWPRCRVCLETFRFIDPHRRGNPTMVRTGRSKRINRRYSRGSVVAELRCTQCGHTWFSTIVRLTDRQE